MSVPGAVGHRRHAVIEAVFVDGPLAHMPARRFGAKSAWILCAAIAHNLLRSVGVLVRGGHAAARGVTAVVCRPSKRGALI